MNEAYAELIFLSTFYYIIQILLGLFKSSDGRDMPNGGGRDMPNRYIDVIWGSETNHIVICAGDKMSCFSIYFVIGPTILTMQFSVLK